MKSCENYQNMTQRHKVSKYYWKNGVHRFGWCRVATDLQFGEKKHKWNAVSAKYDKVKYNKLRYVCMFPFDVKSVLPQQAWCSHCMWKNGQRIHVFEGCLIWIQLVSLQEKFLRSPKCRSVFLSPSSLVLSWKISCVELEGAPPGFPSLLQDCAPKNPAQGNVRGVSSL